MILSCNNIGKSFGIKQVLNNISFHINDNEKAAIIGVNGAGKSTLLKIIMKQLSPDQGEVIFSKGATVGYLAQHQELSSSNTIYDEMLLVKKEVIELDRKIRQLEQDMKHASHETLDKMLELYTKYTHEFEIQNGYAYKSEVTGILKGLGFSEADFTRTCSTLSGGQKTRIALGRLLLSNPDIILLDEPTNHLDLESIAWLENYLLNYKGAVIIVAHDRYFLDKVVSKVIEIEHAKAQMFLGNYSEYAKKKELLRDTMIKQYYNQQKEIKHQEEVITKLRSFNREKSIKRAESREKLLNKIEVLEKPTKQQHMVMQLDPSIISGNDVLSVKDLKKSFGSVPLYSDINFHIKREEKVAIIGNNGTGKTTILKIINGLIPADSGEFSLGNKVKIGYYDQEHQVLNLEKTLFEEIQDTYPHLNNIKIRNTLAAFLFTEDDVFKKIKDLSGGERGRVSLAKLMLSEANFLILDEPTNHLDITSKEILENALRHYTGTVLYVSHDRYFINKTATRILDLTHQKLLNYIGNYDYYLEKKVEIECAAGLITPCENIVTPQISEANNMKKLFGRDNNTVSKNNQNNKLTWQQQKEEQARQRKLKNQLTTCEQEIEKLEQRNEEIDTFLALEEVYTNVEKLMAFNKEKVQIEKELTTQLELWETLAQ